MYRLGTETFDPPSLLDVKQISHLIFLTPFDEFLFASSQGKKRWAYHSKKFLNHKQGFPVRAPILSWGWFSSTDRLQRPSSSSFFRSFAALARQQLQAPKVWIKRWFHLVFPTSTPRIPEVMGVLQRSIYHMVIMPIGQKSICPLFFCSLIARFL